jgi:Spy/CpxP family protein refolding chaperone
VNDWKVIFATAVIFGAGVITGGLLVNHVQQPHFKQPHVKAAATENHSGSNSVSNASAHPSENARLRPPEILSKQFLQQLDGLLHLNGDQRDAIQKVIGDGQNEIRKVIQDARLEIRDVLTPGQQKQFDELMKRPFRRPIYGTNTAVVLPSVTNSPATATNTP